MRHIAAWLRTEFPIVGRKSNRRTFAIIFLMLTTFLPLHAQTFDTLETFRGSNGSYPYYGSLVQGIDGGLYGTTVTGGQHNDGTIFKIDSRQRFTSLYSFAGLDGANPYAGLLLGKDGRLYGTTADGGTYNRGTIFAITHNGILTTLYSFCRQPTCPDGEAPVGELAQAANGSLYGTTQRGGANDGGTVFNISLEGALTTLYNFCTQPNCYDGSAPRGRLVQFTDGSFYGITVSGGRDVGGVCNIGCGTVFKITPSGTLTTLYRFCAQTNCADGYWPNPLLIQSNGKSFYGTTQVGGVGTCKEGCGTIFKMNPRGVLTTLYNFCPDNGCRGVPYAGLMEATDGNFYGTTYYDGINDLGSIFETTPAGLSTFLYSFCSEPGCADGEYTMAGLFQATNGSFYGTTFEGGNSKSEGIVYKLSVGLDPFVAFVFDSAEVGGVGGILGQGLTGATNVSVNGTPANFKVISDTFLKATVPSGATTGFVTVTTASGILQSNVPFRVLPQLLSFDPPSGPRGTQVTITGVSLTQTLGVGFGDRAPAQFTVNSDTTVTATVPQGAKTGKIGIETKGGVAISQGTFEVTE